MDPPLATPASGAVAPDFIVVVEDDANVRRALTLLLQQRFAARRIETFATGQPAIDFCACNPVVLLLTDLGLPDMHGLEIIRQLRAARRVEHVIVMTGTPTDDLPRELWDLGVAGFIDKTSLHEHVQVAVERVLAGGMYFSVQVTPARLPGTPAAMAGSGSTSDDAGLSPRERDVARLVASGLLTKEIAAQLNLSPRTVEKYRARVMHKIGARSVPQLVYWCLQRGIV